MKKLYNISELKTSIKNYYYEKNLNYQKEKLEQLHIKYHNYNDKYLIKSIIMIILQRNGLIKVYQNVLQQ